MLECLQFSISCFTFHLLIHTIYSIHAIITCIQIAVQSKTEVQLTESAMETNLGSSTFVWSSPLIPNIKWKSWYLLFSGAALKHSHSNSSNWSSWRALSFCKCKDFTRNFVKKLWSGLHLYFEFTKQLFLISLNPKKWQSGVAKLYYVHVLMHLIHKGIYIVFRSPIIWFMYIYYNYLCLNVCV